MKTEDELEHSRAAREKVMRALRRRYPHLPAPASSIDLAAVRASIRRARVEDEVDKRVAAQADGRLLRIAEVKKLTGLGRTTIWQLERDGQFPQRVKLSGARGRAVGYRASEVARWIAERMAARQS